ncbi:MAG: FG-GAP repeat protein [Phycisphaerales bacterium]|nr:FG-GAP repeat protein [Phycisphaerales bacterium]
MNQKHIFTLVLSMIASIASTQVINESNKFTAQDGATDDEYGYAVAISGTRVLVGSPYDDDFGDDSGSVYVRSGQQSFKLNASDAAAGDRFGWSVASSGSFAIVGAPYNTDNGFGTGAAYVFDLSTGQELYKLLAPVPDGSDYFGISVAMDGAFAIVGADGVDDFGTASGAAFVFDLTTGIQVQKLTATLGATQDHFGSSVDIEGNFAVIGAW